MREAGFAILVMVTAAAAFSQEPKPLASPVFNQVDPGDLQLSPAVKNAIDKMRGKLASDLPGGEQQLMQPLAGPTYPAMAKSRDLSQLAPPKSGPCSVPLLQTQIPKDVHFAMEILPPPTEHLEPMPHAVVPAPACDSSAGQ